MDSNVLNAKEKQIMQQQQTKQPQKIKQLIHKLPKSQLRSINNLEHLLFNLKYYACYPILGL